MPTPILLTPIPEENLLRVLWDDDVMSDYPYVYLRGWCPCAVCQGHGGERHFTQVEDPQLVSVNLVGNETGIYTFEYLRELSDSLASRNSPDEAQ